MRRTFRLLAISAIGVSMSIACSSSTTGGSSSSSSESSGGSSGKSSSGASGGSSKSGSSGTGASHKSGTSGATSHSGTGSSVATASSYSSTSYGTATATAFCESLLQAESGLLSHCLGGAQGSWSAALAPLAPCSEIAAAVSGNRVTFDESSAASCISAYPSLTCTSSTAVPMACSAALSGAVAVGSTCQSGIDCATGSYCKVTAASPCSGTCTTDIAAGATCGLGDVCVSGYECTGKCTAIPAPTGPASAGGACGYNTSTKVLTSCADGLACDLGTKVCVAVVAQGGACSDGAGVCAPFTYCDPTTKTCKPDPGVGGDCGAAAGQDVIFCAPGTYCDVTTGTAGKCATLLGTGAACKNAGQCASGFCTATDGGTGMCLAACTEE